MKFLFAIVLCFSSYTWAQDVEVTVGTPDTASMRIGEAASGANTTGNPIVTGIACDACEAHAMSQNIHTKGITTNPAADAGTATPAGNNGSTGASQE